MLKRACFVVLSALAIYGLAWAMPQDAVAQTARSRPVSNYTIVQKMRHALTTELRVETDSFVLVVGDVAPVHARLTLPNGTEVNAAVDGIWTVSDRNVVSVKAGRIFALAPGQATLQLRSHGEVANLTVTVREKAGGETPTVKQPSIHRARRPAEVPTISQRERAESSVASFTPSRPSNPVVVQQSKRDDNISNLETIVRPRKRSLTPPSVPVVTPSRTKPAPALTAPSAPASKQTGGEVEAISSSADGMTKNFTWQYQGKGYNWSVGIPASLLKYNQEIFDTAEAFYSASSPLTQYNMLQEMSPETKALVLAESSKSNGNLTPWVTDSTNNAFMRLMAAALEAKAKAEGFDRFQTAEFALRFVQTMPYRYEEYAELPGQTLITSGDCDGKSVLAAAILKNMGYDVALLYYSPESTGMDIGHMATAIAFDRSAVPEENDPATYYSINGRSFYLGETTSIRPIGGRITWKVTAEYLMQ